MTYSQSYEDGWADGYRQGTVDQEYGCEPFPVVPHTPYLRGFVEGHLVGYGAATLSAQIQAYFDRAVER